MKNLSTVTGFLAIFGVLFMGGTFIWRVENLKKERDDLRKEVARLRKVNQGLEDQLVPGWHR